MNEFHRHRAARIDAALRSVQIDEAHLDAANAVIKATKRKTTAGAL